MKIVLQRVLEASVSVDSEVKGQIGKGYLLLLGVSNEDTKEIADKMIEKISRLRIFEDENEKINKSLKDVEGSLLIISATFLNCSASASELPPNFKTFIFSLYIKICL